MRTHTALLAATSLALLPPAALAKPAHIARRHAPAPHLSSDFGTGIGKPAPHKRGVTFGADLSPRDGAQALINNTIKANGVGAITGPVLNAAISSLFPIFDAFVTFNPATGVPTLNIAPGSITAAMLAPGVVPTSLPIGGAAGGDLGGSFPNPSVLTIGGKAPATIATSGNLTDGLGLLGIGQLPAGVPDIPIVPGLSQSTNTYTGLTSQAGSGRINVSNTDFQVGQGVLVPGQGSAFPTTYTAPTLGTLTVVGTAGTTTRCYVLVPLDGAQGYGTPSAQACVANAPSTPGVTSYVNIPWTEGATPAPSYAIYEGPTGGPYASLIDFRQGGGANGATVGYDYGRAASTAEIWLPTSVTANQVPQNDAIHSIVTAIYPSYVDVGFGAATGNKSVTLYHDNVLPLRQAVANEAAGTCVKLPSGTFPVSGTGFGGSTITSSGQCLVGADQGASRLLLITGRVAAPFLSESGAGAILRRFTLDTGGFNSDQNALLAIAGATRFAGDDLTFLRVPKNTISNSGSTSTTFRRFLNQSAPDFANQSTFVHSVHSTDTKFLNGESVGSGFDMADNRCEIGGVKVSNFVSAAVGTEQDPFDSACSIHDDDFLPATTGTADINATVTECVESWGPDDSIENNRCYNPIGSAYSIGGKRSRVLGNFASASASNPNAAIAIRMDSATYNGAGSMVSGNTDTGSFAYGLAEVGTASTCAGCIFGINGWSGTTAAINTGSLQGGEKFATLSTTPQ